MLCKWSTTFYAAPARHRSHRGAAQLKTRRAGTETAMVPSQLQNSW